jgi:hypothetical protein
VGGYSLEDAMIEPTPLMSFKDLLDLFQKQYALTNVLWTFFSTVTLALVSTVVASDKIKTSRANTLWILGAYAVFAAGNWVVVSRAHRTAVALADAVNAAAATSAQTKAIDVVVASVLSVQVFHLGCALAAIIAALAITHRTWR